MFLCASILCWEVHSGAYPPHLLPTCSPSPGSFRRFWFCILPCHPHPRPLDAIAPFPPLPQCTRQVGYLQQLDKPDEQACLWSLSEPWVLMSGQSHSGEQAAIPLYPPGTMCVSC